MLAIDLKSPLYHSWTAQRQDWRVEKWLRTLKISKTKLETHPYFEDVVSLLMFDQWQSYMTTIDKDIWTHCWQHCYHRELALSGYQKRKLISIIDHIELRQTRQYQIEKRLAKRSAAGEIGKRELHNDDNRSRSLGLVATDPDHECVVDGLSLAG